MKQYLGFLMLCAILLLSPVIAQSQRLTPSYLSEMPAPARVVNEIKGKDPADSGARQMGAFAVLVKIMNDMAYGLEHRSERQLTPDEQRITQVYTKTYTDVWQKVKDTYGRQYDGEYNNDRDLLVEVLDKFFSPNFRAQYLKLNGFAAAWYRKVHANGETSGTTSANPNTGPANSPGARTPAGTDPSIPKAVAAHVDTKVYGVQLGAPLKLPTCPSAYGDLPETCFYEGEQDAFSKELEATAAALFGSARDRDPHDEWKMVYVHNGPKADVLLHDGLVAAIRLGTNGINDVDLTTKNLREKYGPPTSVKPFTYTPRVGNILKASDLEWRLPGLHVEYSAVLKRSGALAEPVSINEGYIYVETETAYQRRVAKEKEQENNRTKM